jgi:hypothetical protein
MKTTLYAMLGIVMLSLVIAFANMSQKSHQAELKQNPNYHGWYTVMENTTIHSRQSEMAAGFYFYRL